jgi:iron complex transport system substrate-binding protein
MLNSLFVLSSLFPSRAQTTQKGPISVNLVKPHRKSSLVFLIFIFILLLFITTKVQASQYPLEIDNLGHKITYYASPKRVVVLNQHAIEIMMAIGLEGKIIGTAYLDDEIIPEYKEKFEKINYLSDKYPSQEILLSMNPDFVYAGFKSAFGTNGVGTRETLQSLGINTYLNIAHNQDDQINLDSLFADFYDLGAIFEIEDQANDVAKKIRQEIDNVTSQIGGIAQPVSVFIYDSENPPYTAGGWGVPNLIVECAGGRNIFSNLPKKWTTVSWEEVVAADPQVIVLIECHLVTSRGKEELLTRNESFSGSKCGSKSKIRSITIYFYHFGDSGSTSYSSMRESLPSRSI